MNTAVIIYPHQLFATLPMDLQEKYIILLEEPLYFGSQELIQRYHKQKLVLLRASMHAYYESLKKKLKPKNIHYLEYTKTASLTAQLKKLNIEQIEAINPIDKVTRKKIKNLSNKLNLKLYLYSSPNFLTSPKQLKEYSEQSKKPYFHAEFYKWQRKRLQILIDKKDKPQGGQWSYDEDNRQKLPESIKIPDLPKLETDKYISEAVNYVEHNFPDNPGKAQLLYPHTHELAADWLSSFLQDRLTQFGPYEDAITQRSSAVFHAVLTPSLNIGLLTPQQIINKTLTITKNKNVPLASLEGFIRQIIGWREFIRFIYIHEETVQRKSNFFEHKNTLNEKFYTGSTGITPVDNLVHQLQETAYSHHITRLMILGNFFLITEISPTEVYKWFMEMYVDAYDWVMVPNVFGMSQFADGGKIVTKPYFSSSNYIKKMSDYNGQEAPPTNAGKKLLDQVSKHYQEPITWQDIWDGLFWRFIKKHASYLKQNARMGFLTNQTVKHEAKIALAEVYLKYLH